MLDYSKEPVNDYFLIDMKPFYASIECIERNFDPLTTELVVMSRADNTGLGLILELLLLKQKSGMILQM